MKIIYLAFLATIIVTNVSAKTWTVNNNEGASADYAILQTAIDAADTGDTLLISGSPNYYDDELIRLNKTLTLIGPGYFLGENEETQSSNQTAKIYRMEIGEGADNSLIMGLDFETSHANLNFSKDKRDGTHGTSSTQNIILKRNIIHQLDLSYTFAVVVEQNYFVNTGRNIEFTSSCSGILVLNNIFASGSSAVIGQSAYELSNTVIKNNTFIGGLYRINGVEISNNIFIDGILNDCENNTIKNNVFVKNNEEVIPTNSAGNTLQNNTFSVTASELFVKATQNTDNDYILKANSPAKGAGMEGIDAGAFGGLNAYKLSGLPPIPSIYELSTNGIGTIEDGLSITIKAKSNN